MKAADIRASFLDYFGRNKHQPVASSSLIPRDDPSLLFTNAGMVQFKKLFLGQEKRDYARATSSQKCLRVGGKHNDLENVGHTARHHTFFEMLGNFSFGDYFKEQAIELAWNYVTRELALDKSRLYATVYLDDDEAWDLWKKISGLPDERIFRLGEKENFWAMGDTGPCGPCSEIHIDQGEHMACGPNCGIGKCDCDRFLEIWNLVFMQFERDAGGKMTPLPRPSIDTGMGLERIAAVCQGVYSNFDTDLFQNLIGCMAERARVGYGKDSDVDTALRVITDHSRAIAFLIADGMLPSNEGRGYVLRRLIRRALRFGRLIGLSEAFLYESSMDVVREMGNCYPELHGNKDFMVRVVRKEEESFGEALDKGLRLLEDEMDALRQAGKACLGGAAAFKLYDTYGFPLDIVNDVVEKNGFCVDEAGFQKLMDEQKQKARQAWSGSGEKDIASQFAPLLAAGLESEFVGYELAEVKSRIVALLDKDSRPVDELGEGQSGYVVTARTPFYAESGGQVSDSGEMHGPTGEARVVAVVKPAAGLIVHGVEITQGAFLADQNVVQRLNRTLRRAVAANHTCTHLLHAALRSVLGDHVKQAGSLVSADRLRFDFSHISPLTSEERQQVEDLVNKAISEDLKLEVSVMDYRTAVQEKGAMALFGEKYTDAVRVVDIPEISLELCGGTHLQSTAQALSFCILSENGISCGVRRIEAISGQAALDFWRERRDETEKLAVLLKCRPADVSGRVASLLEENKNLARENRKLQDKLTSAGSCDLVQSCQDVCGIRLLAHRVDGADMNSLRSLMDDLRSKIASGVICLAGENQGKVMLLLAVSKDLHGCFTAPQLIRNVASHIGGSGGGRPDLAQAGGSDAAGIERAFACLKCELEKKK